MATDYASAKVAAARTTPWIGVEGHRALTDKVMTAEEAIKLADLDWDVELRKVYTLNGAGNRVLIPGNFAVTRETDDQVFGVVKSRYTVFQNRDAFAFADSLVDSGEAKYEAVGSLKGGRQIFLTMKLPDGILVGGEDRHDLYVMLRTSHDGSKAVTVNLTPIRLACTNMMTIATRAAEGTDRWSMPHVSTMQGRIAEARETLSLTFAYAEEFAKIGEQLMSIKLTDDQAVDALQNVLPHRPKTDEKIDDIMECLRGSNSNGYHGTGWGLLNALTEYHEHWRDNIQPEATFFNTVDGEIRRWRNQLTNVLLAA